MSAILIYIIIIAVAFAICVNNADNFPPDDPNF